MAFFVALAHSMQIRSGSDRQSSLNSINRTIIASNGLMFASQQVHSVFTVSISYGFYAIVIKRLNFFISLRWAEQWPSLCVRNAMRMDGYELLLVSTSTKHDLFDRNRIILYDRMLLPFFHIPFLPFPLSIRAAKWNDAIAKHRFVFSIFSLFHFSMAIKILRDYICHRVHWCGIALLFEALTAPLIWLLRRLNGTMQCALCDAAFGCIVSDYVSWSHSDVAFLLHPTTSAFWRNKEIKNGENMTYDR